MLNRTLALLLIFSLAFNIAFVGIWAYVRTHPAAPPPPAPGSGPEEAPGTRRDAGRGGGRMPWARLDLDPSQEEELRQLWADYQDQMRTLGREAGEHRSGLFELLEAEDLDTEAIQAEQDAIDDAQQEMSRLTLDQMRRVHRILSPEQRRRWLQTLLAHGERLRGRFGEPGRGRGPRGMRPPEGSRGGPRGRWGRPAGRPGPQPPRRGDLRERRQEDEEQ
jgi:Spy/CpxP family protein refolding chaperone